MATMSFLSRQFFFKPLYIVFSVLFGEVFMGSAFRARLPACTHLINSESASTVWSYKDELSGHPIYLEENGALLSAAS